METEVPNLSLASTTIACNSFRYGAKSEFGKEGTVLVVDSEEEDLREVQSGEVGI